jgi:hypothetical protein
MPLSTNLFLYYSKGRGTYGWYVKRERERELRDSREYQEKLVAITGSISRTNTRKHTEIPDRQARGGGEGTHCFL